LAIIIDAPLDKVWQVITDFENYPNFIPGHKECKIIKRHGNEITVESAVTFKFMGIGSTVRYTTKHILKKPELIIVDTEKNRQRGCFKLIPIDEGRRVVLFYNKEAKDVKDFGRVAKFLIIQKPEMEFPLQVSPLRINIKAIKERAEVSKVNE
ncbi:MAG: SRPBCC family protein, partial [Candidatus Cloacimonetes bacterium]|nr:SRPBCC family protein [Candidatus Cloacimonadota bacterium]